MDLLLSRETSTQEGTFSTLCTKDGTQLFVTAEHAYLQGDGSWLPKIPVGTYTCQRREARLQDLVPFVTFEVLDVPGHTNILFHKGNLPEKDSEGCILLGTSFGELGSDAAVLQSSMAFVAFMNLQQGVDKFELTVS